VTVLITTQRVTGEDLKTYAASKLPTIILHDPERAVFGAYEVAVMPSAVVIDAEGRVVHAVAGLSSRFEDTLLDSLLLAAGKLSVEKFDQAMAGQTAAGPSEQAIRAERIAQLAKQLASRGLDDMAMEKYAEALKLDPARIQARQELGMLLLRKKRLAEAEKEFRTVLAADGKSMQATLGLAYVQTLRGGAELAEAERTVRDALAKNPAQAKAHFLLGLILEQKNKPEDAAASFKKAAQLLLERSEQE
jgi:tetratricopeptide (TPR) repeat protein